MGDHASSSLINMHVPHAFEYADAATRVADTSRVSADLKKLALQLDDYSLWILQDLTPTWVQVGSWGGMNTLLSKDIEYIITNTPSVSFPDVNTKVGIDSATFIDAGGKLNDGRKGGHLYNNNEYIAWNAATGDPTITYDFGSAKLVSEIDIYGLCDTPNGIYFPSAILIEESDNGSSWSISKNETGIAAGSGVYTFVYRHLPATSHRYWRITLTAQTDSLFISEIEFWSN